jgi:hypothetical protein
MMLRIAIYNSGASFCVLNFVSNVTCRLLSLQGNTSLKTVAWIIQMSAKENIEQNSK